MMLASFTGSGHAVINLRWKLFVLNCTCCVNVKACAGVPLERGKLLLEGHWKSDSVKMSANIHAGKLGQKTEVMLK